MIRKFSSNIPRQMSTLCPSKLYQQNDKKYVTILRNYNYHGSMLNVSRELVFLLQVCYSSEQRETRLLKRHTLPNLLISTHFSHFSHFSTCWISNCHQSLAHAFRKQQPGFGILDIGNICILAWKDMAEIKFLLE